MFYSVRRTSVCLVLLVILCACSRQPAGSPARTAVLRFENLTPDVSLDWMGRAASEIISHELSGGKMAVISTSALHANSFAQQRPPGAPGESAERSAAIAEGATRILIGQISRVGNRLEMDVTERDTASNKTIDNFTIATPNAGELYSLADAAARHFSSHATPFETRNNRAIAAWCQGIEEPDYASAGDDYARAVQADPQFAVAWLDWASTASMHGDRAAAAQILRRAGEQASHFSPLDRARLKLATLELTGDRAAILNAMNELGRLSPDDPENIAAIATRNYAARQYQEAVAAYRRLTQLTPNNGLAWNQLGYALMSAGDYNGAMAALQTYQRLAPKDANPPDSQGDVAFAFGRFPEAEKFYGQASARDPAFEDQAPLYKAAAARLMTGDIAGADREFAAWLNARRAAHDPLIDIRRAAWLFISGRRTQALADLGNLVAAPSPQIKAAALTQMAIWNLQLGSRDSALGEAEDALKTHAASANTLIVRFALDDAHNPADWSARADRLFAAPQVAPLKPIALAYALYLAHQWDAAAPHWKEMVDRSSPDDPIPTAIYGQILVELGRPREAEPLVRLFPLPKPEALQEFESLIIPRIFATRAAVFASEGNKAESEASRKVYETLSGAASPAIMSR